MLSSNILLTVAALSGLVSSTPVVKRSAPTTPSTTTVLTTPTVVRTVTVGSTTSALTTIFPTTINTYTETTTTTSATTTQPSQTSVSTLVSTAYLDNSGSTIAIMKRDAQPTNIELTKRNVGVPTYFAGYARADILFTCQCLFTKAPAPITRVLAARPFVSITTKVLPRTIYSKITQILTATVSTQIDLHTNVVTLAAPTITTYQTVLIQSQDSCPPTYLPTFLCPEDTSAALAMTDPNYDPNYASCGVVAPDGYNGFCVYWNDDGQPAGSTLILGDGTGDPTRDLTRAATYGTSAGDDCPFWSDYTCVSQFGTTTLTAIHAKRTFTPKSGSSSSKTYHVKQPMPKAIAGIRGAKYRSSGN